MVNFICDACGQTIKKQKVEKHYQTECRNCSVLSCIDCGKDFPGDSYVSHTSCISEAEKYQGRLYKAKDKANKGERKQQEWLEQVRSASSGSNQDPRVRKLMAKITSYDNVPRKEKKFKKFCENSINIHDQALLEKLWQTFSGARNSIVSMSNNSNDDHNSNKNDVEETKDTGTTLTSSGKNAAPENYESKTADGIEKDVSTSEQLTQKKRKDKNKRKMDTTERETSENSDGKVTEFVDQDEMNHDKSTQKKRKESKREKKKKQRMKEENQMKQVNGTEKDGENVERKTKKKRKMEDDQTNNNDEGMEFENRKKKKIKYETVEAAQKGNEKEENSDLKKKKKRKLNNMENIVEPNAPPSDHQKQKYETGHQSEENVETQEKFKWEAVIKKVLKTAPDNEMAVKKLRKKVINEFLTHGGDSRSRTELELRSLFEKKLHKNPKVKVHKEKAKYCK